MTAVCPNCAFDLSPFEPIQLGDLYIPDRLTVLWRGKEVKLTRQQRLILLAIVRAGGAPVKRWALMEAAGTDTVDADPSNVVDVQLSRIRAYFRQVDLEFDSLETVRSEGVRWRA